MYSGGGSLWIFLHLHVMFSLICSQHLTDKRAFMKTADILNVKIIEKSRYVPIWEKHFPRVYNSAVSQIIVKGIKHK